jgi:hypothetical protein
MKDIPGINEYGSGWFYELFKTYFDQAYTIGYNLGLSNGYNKAFNDFKNPNNNIVMNQHGLFINGKEI